MFTTLFTFPLALFSLLTCAPCSPLLFRTRTQATYTILATAEAAATLVNAIALLVPNAVALAHTCTAWTPLFVWMSWVQWSCWNALLLLWCIAARCSICMNACAGAYSEMMHEMYSTGWFIMVGHHAIVIMFTHHHQHYHHVYSPTLPAQHHACTGVDGAKHSVTSMADAPLRIHAPLLVPWAFFQAVVIAYAVVYTGNMCRRRQYDREIVHVHTVRLCVDSAHTIMQNPCTHHTHCTPNSAPPSTIITRHRMPLFSRLHHTHRGHCAVDAACSDASSVCNAVCTCHTSCVSAVARQAICSCEGHQHSPVGRGALYDMCVWWLIFACADVGVIQMLLSFIVKQAACTGHKLQTRVLLAQIRVRFLALIFVVGCVLVMYAVGWNSCASLRIALLGYDVKVGVTCCRGEHVQCKAVHGCTHLHDCTHLHGCPTNPRYPAEYIIVATASLVGAFLWGPAQTTKRHPILQEWLQWFAW